MSAKLMGEIAKFFSGGKSGAKALLMAYAKFGKDAVNKYFKQREPSYNFTSRNIKRDKMSEAAQKDLLKKNVGGMAESMEKGAKKQFKPKTQTKFMPPKVGKGGPVKVIQIGGKFYKMEGDKMVPIKGLGKKVKQGATFKNGGMVKRRAGAAKRGFNNFKGIF